MTPSEVFRIALRPVVVAITAAVIIRASCFQLFSIPSSSMSPTLLPGDQIVVTPYRLPFNAEPERGDIVVFRHPADGRYLVKRIVAVPGDHIEIAGRQVKVNGRTVAEPYVGTHDEDVAIGPEILPGGAYYVLGDNRANSVDSRVWGSLARETIVGEVRGILWSVAETDQPIASAETRHHFSRARMFPTAD